MNTHHFRAEKDEKQMRGNYYTFPCATWLIASLFLRFYLSLDNRISEMHMMEKKFTVLYLYVQMYIVPAT